MRKITIGITDVFLENFDINQGKITISDTYHGAFTYYWGSMGGTLEEFLCEINTEYFVGKLCFNDQVFSAKNTVKEVRKQVKENLPWYEFMEQQKGLREKIKDLENLDNGNEFVDACYDIAKNFYITGLSEWKKKEFQQFLDDTFACDPWNYICTEASPSAIWLKKIHKELKNILSKESKKT